MVESPPLTPVRLGHGDTFPSAQGLLRPRFERFGAERTIEPAVEVFRLQQLPHAVVIGLRPFGSERAVAGLKGGKLVKGGEQQRITVSARWSFDP